MVDLSIFIKKLPNGFPLMIAYCLIFVLSRMSEEDEYFENLSRAQERLEEESKFRV